MKWMRWFTGPESIEPVVTAFVETYDLYYLANQNGSIDGDKVWVAQLATKEEAHARALADGVQHYSIETDEGYGYTISFIC